MEIVKGLEKEKEPESVSLEERWGLVKERVMKAEKDVEEARKQKLDTKFLEVVLERARAEEQRLLEEIEEANTEFERQNQG